MLATGTKVIMTKGYKDTKGAIACPTDSKFELYIITLATGMKIVAGPSAFIVDESESRKTC